MPQLSNYDSGDYDQPEEKDFDERIISPHDSNY